MVDSAHNKSMQILNELDKDLRRLYSVATRNIQNEADPIIANMYLDDENATQRQRLRYAQRNGLADLILLFVGIMILTNEKAINRINAKTSRIYILNYDFMGDRVEELAKQDLGIKRFGTIEKAEDLIERTRGYYDRRAYNRLTDEKRLTREITKRLDKSIKQGYDKDAITHELQRVINQSKNSSITTANTESTRIINRARFEIMQRAVKMGIKLMKVWRHAIYVAEPREWHLDMDGETTYLQYPFSNDLMYPGEVGAPPDETIHCHCYLDVKIVDK